MRANASVQTYLMNLRPNPNSAPAGRPNPFAVSLIVTETTVLKPAEEIPSVDELPLEKAMQRQATAMTDVLTEIMDRPVTPRFWGLNE